jgi:glycosyltransferase involved in cell wall biosynthesis
MTQSSTICITSRTLVRVDGTQHILFVARLSPEKGVHVLVEAFKMLVERRPKLRLDLVGGAYTQVYLYLAPDPDDKAMATLAAFYGTALSEMVRRQLLLAGQAYLDDIATAATGDNRIVFHGAIPHTETIVLYRRTAVMVLPSVWNAFGTVTSGDGQKRSVLALLYTVWHWSAIAGKRFLMLSVM